MLKEEKVRNPHYTTLYLTGTNEEVVARAGEISLVFEAQLVDAKENKDGTVTLEMYYRWLDR